ncbi:MAG: HAD hydrolase family protein, partial [Collinsella sp.]|nr:HAD hydrolase family protein [Collinsella sp.]
MQTYESDANIGNIKLIAVDMDKTLLTDERVLPQGLDERLDKLAEAGIVFCPASGRPAPKLEEMFEDIKNRLAFCPDNGACVIYRGNYIYKSNIDVALYQQVLARASEDSRAVPVLCCFDEFYVLARDHQYHDEISVYYNTINYV